MSAVGLKPIVEVQFADYIWPGLNQLFTEVSRSCYLTNGKWPVSITIPEDACFAPYHDRSEDGHVAERGLSVVKYANYIILDQAS